MKKRFFSLFAMAAGLFMASCSNDELEVIQSENEAQVTFALSLENGAQTRAISDGTGADRLIYAVFDKEGNRISTIKAVDKTTTFPATESLTLAKGQTYKVAFWAQNNDCKAYTVNTDKMSVAVDYAQNNKNNDETRDAFFKMEEFTVTGSTSISVELKRPFAQINVGVTEEDWNAAVASGITINQSSVVIKNAATSLDLLTGEVANPVEVNYALGDIITERLSVDVDNDGQKENYRWLSMSYILAADETTGDAKTTLEDLSFVFTPENAKYRNIELHEGLNSVPVQRNWRTNILGTFLSGKIDINIMIDPSYDGENNNGENFGVQSGGKYYKTIDEAIKDGAENIELAVGTYKLPAITGKTLTITGASQDTKIDLSDGVTLSGTSVAFKNVSIVKENENYVGFHHAGNLTYDNCVFENQYWAYGTSETFDNCVFNQTSADAYNVWTYGAKNATFNNCVFNSAGKAVLVYKEAGTERYKAIFNNCEFNASAPVEGKAAIEIDASLNPYDVTINSCTANGFAVGSVSGNMLYNLKKGELNTDCTITLQGKNIM